MQLQLPATSPPLPRSEPRFTRHKSHYWWYANNAPQPVSMSEQRNTSASRSRMLLTWGKSTTVKHSAETYSHVLLQRHRTTCTTACRDELFVKMCLFHLLHPPNTCLLIFFAQIHLRTDGQIVIPVNLSPCIHQALCPVLWFCVVGSLLPILRWRLCPHQGSSW